MALLRETGLGQPGEVRLPYPRHPAPVGRAIAWKPAKDAYHLLAARLRGSGYEHELYVTQRVLLQLLEHAGHGEREVDGTLWGRLLVSPDTGYSYVLIADATVGAPEGGVQTRDHPDGALRPAGWYCTRHTIEGQLSSEDVRGHLERCTGGWEPVIVFSGHMNRGEGGIYLVSPTSQRSFRAPFRELLDPQVIRDNAPKRSCIPWREYATDEPVVSLPPRERALARAASAPEIDTRSVVSMIATGVAADVRAAARVWSRVIRPSQARGADSPIDDAVPEVAPPMDVERTAHAESALADASPSIPLAPIEPEARTEVPTLATEPTRDAEPPAAPPPARPRVQPWSEPARTTAPRHTVPDEDVAPLSSPIPAARESATRSTEDAPPRTIAAMDDKPRSESSPAPRREPVAPRREERLISERTPVPDESRIPTGVLVAGSIGAFIGAVVLGSIAVRDVLQKRSATVESTTGAVASAADTVDSTVLSRPRALSAAQAGMLSARVDSLRAALVWYREIDGDHRAGRLGCTLVVRARDRVVAQRDSLGEVLATLPDSRRAFSTPRALLNDATNIERAVASSDCATSARRNQPG